MVKRTRINDVYEFRIIKERQYNNILRFADGDWIPDDGEYDLAFAYMDGGCPMVLYVDMPYRGGLLWSWCLHGNWGARLPEHGGNAWHYMYADGFDRDKSWHGRDEHPNEIAGKKGMDMMSERHGCSNGHGVDFNPLDEHIDAGLVRNRKTKKIIKAPKIFKCVVCHKNKDWKKAEDKAVDK